MVNASHKFCGNSCAGKWKYRNSDKVRSAIAKGLRKAHDNLPERVRRTKKGKPRPDMRGERNPNWKGGKRRERETAMGRIEYKLWRASVFKRDGFTCVLCHTPKQKIQAHHIVPWRRERERRYDPNNGVTLCKPCHCAINHRESHFEPRFLEYVKSKAPCVLTAEEVETFNAAVKLNCAWCGKDFQRNRGNISKLTRRHFCAIQCKKAFETAKRFSPELPFGVH